MQASRIRLPTRAGATPAPHGENWFPRRAGRDRQSPREETSFESLSREPLERRAAVVRVEVHIQQTEARQVLVCGVEGGIEFAHGFDLEPHSGPDHFRNFVIGPVLDVVERPLQQESLGRIAVIIEHHDDGIELVLRNG